MKIALLLSLLLCVAARAESLYPKELVATLIRSVQANELNQTIECVDFVAVSQHARHPLAPKEVVRSLRKISLPESTLEDPHDYSNFSWPETVTVRLTGAVSLDFDLRLVRATVENQEDHYVVTAIHP